MSPDSTPHENLPKAPPPTGRRQPLLDRLRGRPWPLVDVLVAKTRTCPLCDGAMDLLERSRGPLGLEIRVHDITEDPELMAAYGSEVPVVFIDGKKRFFGRVDPVLLKRAVEGARTAGTS